MSTSVVRILVVGPNTSSTLRTISQLSRAGWGSHCVASLREAETVLKTIQFKVVLSAEYLPDGTGYDMAALIERQCGSLFIGVSLSETCLWLPVVEQGIRSLGKRALNPESLDVELQDLLLALPEPTAIFRFEARQASVAGTATNIPMFRSAIAAEPRSPSALENVDREVPSRPMGEAQRATTKVSMPPRRKFVAINAMSEKRAHSSAPTAIKMTTGAPRKLWHG
jgi:hypothetical protein